MTMIIQTYRSEIKPELVVQRITYGTVKSWIVINAAFMQGGQPVVTIYPIDAVYPQQLIEQNRMVQETEHHG